LKDILQKTRKSVRVIDPILDELAESAVINDPSEVFKFYITETSKLILQEQIRKHQISIMCAIKRSEYSLIKYKLDQLTRLNSLIEQD
jgi:hypothetical protein